MTFSKLTRAEIERRLQGPGLQYRIGPFAVRLRADLPDFAALLEAIYPDYPLDDHPFADIHVRVGRAPGLKARWRGLGEVRVDDGITFATFPLEAALPHLEWAINWCVGMRAHQYLMLHSAVVERNGQAVILPGIPGAGKSTLSAALSRSGWRLLSDEFGLVRPHDLALVPFPRLIPLKNDSIELIHRRCPGAILGPRIPNTRKGLLSHLRPPDDSVHRAREPAPARWLIFPTYSSGAPPARLNPLARSQAFVRVSGNSFNYQILGLEGFRTTGRLVEGCHCRLLDYSSLDGAIQALDELVADQPPPALTTGPSAGL